MHSFLQNNSGDNSSMRLMSVVWAFGVLLALGYVVVTSGTIPEIPASILAVLGMFLTGKVAEKHIEEKPKQ